jgi:hypothetical protein
MHEWDHPAKEQSNKCVQRDASWHRVTDTLHGVCTQRVQGAHNELAITSQGTAGRIKTIFKTCVTPDSVLSTEQ